MRRQTTTTIATYAILALAGGVSFVLPDKLHVESASASPPPATMRITGVIRDFMSTHPDFGATPVGGNGHYAGNVSAALDSEGRPTFVGQTVSAGPMKDFSIINCALKPQQNYAAMITVIGAAINSGTYDRPVTVRINIGSDVIEPFGLYTKALAGNVNKAGNPRKHVQNGVYPANTPVYVTGKSWAKTSTGVSGASESHWTLHREFSTSTATPQIKVLKNGDPVPNIAGFMGQLAAKQFLVQFVDPVTQKMVMNDNQTIYLFELGVVDLTNPAADFQDLVVLVTLGEAASYLNTCDAFGKGGVGGTVTNGYKVNSEWRDNASHNIAPNKFNAPSTCGAVNDVPGGKGAPSTGGIKDAETFDQWFNDVLGVNAAGAHTIELTDTGSGIFEYFAANFHPIDGRLLGNEGQAHNNFFTFAISAEFTYDACGGQFFEFQGSDDAWLYVNGQLAMDLGGIIPGTSQYVSMDRMGLTDGETYELKFLHAQRQTSISSFRMRTNIDLESQPQNMTVSASCD